MPEQPVRSTPSPISNDALVKIGSENEQGKFKRAIKRLFCIGYVFIPLRSLSISYSNVHHLTNVSPIPILSAEQMYHVQLPPAPVGRQHQQHIGPHSNSAGSVRSVRSIAAPTPPPKDAQSKFGTTRSAGCFPVVDIRRTAYTESSLKPALPA